MPKFDDEDDDDSERKKLQIKIRKAVYKEVIKEPNGKLSVHASCIVCIAMRCKICLAKP